MFSTLLEIMLPSLLIDDSWVREQSPVIKKYQEKHHKLYKISMCSALSIILIVFSISFIKTEDLKLVILAIPITGLGFIFSLLMIDIWIERKVNENPDNFIDFLIKEGDQVIKTEYHFKNDIPHQIFTIQKYDDEMILLKNNFGNLSEVSVEDLENNYEPI